MLVIPCVSSRFFSFHSQRPVSRAQTGQSSLHRPRCSSKSTSPGSAATRKWVARDRSISRHRQYRITHQFSPPTNKCSHKFAFFLFCNFFFFSTKTTVSLRAAVVHDSSKLLIFVVPKNVNKSRGIRRFSGAVFLPVLAVDQHCDQAFFRLVSRPFVKWKTHLYYVNRCHPRVLYLVFYYSLHPSLLTTVKFCKQARIVTNLYSLVQYSSKHNFCPLFLIFSMYNSNFKSFDSIEENILCKKTKTSLFCFGWSVKLRETEWKCHAEHARLAMLWFHFDRTQFSALYHAKLFSYNSLPNRVLV